MISLVVSVLLGILLLLLVAGLIFRPDFRDALLGGEGEATIFGVLTVKGVAVVLLSAIFTIGMVYPLHRAPSACEAPLNEIKGLVDAKNIYEGTPFGQVVDRDKLNEIIEKIKEAVDRAMNCTQGR